LASTLAENPSAKSIRWPGFSRRARRASARQRPGAISLISVISIGTALRRARRDHLGVVEHHEIAGPHQSRQRADDMVIQARADLQQPRAVPWRRRPLRDRLGRQRKIKLGNLHRQPP
jgi:hypothetical protein